MIASLINKYKIKLNNNLHFKEILFGSANTIIIKVIGMLVGLGITLIISQRYGTEGVGLYSLSIRTLIFLAIVSTLGISTSILRYVGQFNKTGSRYKLKLLYRHSIQVVLPVSIFFGILLFFTSELIANDLFHNIKYKESLRILSITIPFMAILNISVQFIRGLKFIKVSESLRSVTRSTINIILLISIGIFIHHYLLPVYTFALALCLTATISVIYIYIKTHNIQNPSKQTLFTKIELLKTSLPMMLVTILPVMLVFISIYLLEVFTSTEQVGVFSVCISITSLISLALVSVNTIAAPKFSELYWSNKHIELQNVIFHSSKLIFIFSLISGMLFIYFAKTILALFGSDFIGGNIVLIILIIGQLFNALTGSVGLLLNMTGHQRNLRNIILIVFIINILLNIILIPLYNIVGAAIVNMVTALLINLISAIYSYKKLSLLTIYLPFFSYRLINQ